MKQLLIKLLDFLEKENPEDGKCIYTRYQCAEGLCSLIRDMYHCGNITKEERDELNDFLNLEIKKSEYNDYPVIYGFCDYGSKCSLFFFEPRNWTIRRKWLNQLISQCEE